MLPVVTCGPADSFLPNTFPQGVSVVLVSCLAALPRPVSYRPLAIEKRHRPELSEFALSGLEMRCSVRAYHPLQEKDNWLSPLLSSREFAASFRSPSVPL